MPVSSVTEHWIRPDALTINLNHFGDPDYLQVSLLAGAVVMAFKQDVIGYNAAHNYRTWPLQAANTYLETSSAYHVYARLTRSEVNASALIVYDSILRDINGREITYDSNGNEQLGESNPSYFFIYLGTILPSTNEYGTTVLREWESELNFGTLNTNQYQNEETTGEWVNMFRLNKITDMIDVLKTISSAVFNKLFIKNKLIEDIKRSVDSDEDVPVSDESIPTTLAVQKMGDERYLSKLHDDATPHSIGIGKDLSVGGSASVQGNLSAGGNATLGGNLAHRDFAKDAVGGAYRIAKTDDGEWEAEVDRIVARVKAQVYDLMVRNHATFMGDITSEEFVSGFLSGKGWAIRIKNYLNAAGVREKKSVAEVDDLIVRGSMRVYEFIVSQLLGENDNRIFTAMMEVDHYDASEGKIYLKTDNGKLYNPFRVNDVLVVQQYGGMPTEANGYYVTKQYELIVTGVGVGDLGSEDRLDWITFRNFTTSIEGGDVSLITERDTLVRLDNISDVNRKGIVQITAVGEDTPYIDFLYGAKTDPDNALKGRLGNLGGIYNPLFGTLSGFGAYLTNLYAVGEFKIAHTGEDVADAIEMAKGSFRTNFRQTTYDITEKDNFFTNASFTNDCEGWTLGEESTEYFLVDGLPQYFNYDLYASEKNFAGIASYDNRDMLRVFSSSARQANSSIRKPSTHKVYGTPTQNADGTFNNPYTEEPDTVYLNIRIYCHADGEFECGFIKADGTFHNNIFHKKQTYQANIDAYEISLAGTWNGSGDFYIRTTGDFYIDRLSLTDDPLANFQITTSTAIVQDAARISLLGKKVNGIEGSVTNLGIELKSAEERITAYVDKEVAGVSKSLSDLTVSVGNISATVGKISFDANGNISNINKSGLVIESNFASLFSTQVTSQGVAKTSEIKAYVDDKVSKIKISADQISITGNDLIEIINKDGTIALDGKNINLDGAFTANDLFKINENGYMSCSGGRIGDFVIANGILENLTNRAEVVIKDRDYVTPRQVIEIGLSTQADEFPLGYGSAVGMFRNDAEGSLNNVSLIVSAKGATDENIALYMLGGCIAGFAEKSGIYNNGKTITHEDTVAVAIGANIYLPVMDDLADDGHKITIISNYASSTYIHPSGSNFIIDGSSTNINVMSVTIAARSTVQFVFLRHFTHTFPSTAVGVKNGAWVKI